MHHVRHLKIYILSRRQRRAMTRMPALRNGNNKGGSRAACSATNNASLVHQTLRKVMTGRTCMAAPRCRPVRVKSTAAIWLPDSSWLVAATEPARLYRRLREPARCSA